MDPKTYAIKYGVSEDAVRTTMRRIETGENRLLVMSGKLGAGKDTIAPILMDKLEPLGFEGNRVHESFATALKTEIDEIIQYMREYMSSNDCKMKTLDAIHTKLDAPVWAAAGIWDILHDSVIADASTNSHSRTKSMRKALQYWGTEVRRKTDGDYWVRKTVSTVVGLINSGSDVYITDARFCNELDSMVELSATVVRLDISDAEQDRRIMARDGLKVSKAARTHVSETAADDYDGFTVRLCTDGMTVDDTVDAILSELNSSND